MGSTCTVHVRVVVVQVFQCYKAILICVSIVRGFSYPQSAHKQTVYIEWNAAWAIHVQLHVQCCRQQAVSAIKASSVQLRAM